MATVVYQNFPSQAFSNVLNVHTVLMKRYGGAPGVRDPGR